MGTKIVNKGTLEQRVRKLIAGTLKHPPTGPLTVDGQPLTADALVQVLQGLVDALAKVSAARAQWQEALNEMHDVHAKVVPFIGRYRSVLAGMYGDAPATLEDYGLTPRKVPVPKTAEQKAAAAALRKATRAVRHTMGKRQRKAVKASAPVTKPESGAVQAPAGAPSPAAQPTTATKPS
jgi:hypothetical protein